MKKTLLCAAIAAFVSAPLMASDTQLIGTVNSVCEANVDGTLLMDFGIDPTAGDVASQDVEIQCNDGDGATVQLRSAEGGLESDDNEDLSVEYTAELTAAPIGLSLSMTTDPGPGTNDQSVSQTVAGSSDLASGVTATLDVTLDETPVYAGGYSDTLSVEITAN